MERRIPRPGEIYNHFKDKPYQILTVATHSETGEAMVVYQALYGDFKTYVRPLAMFMSEVDHEKYPETTQFYRFELRDVQSVNQKETDKAASKAAASSTASGVNEAVVVLDKKVVAKTEAAEEAAVNEAILIKESGEVNSLLMDFLDAVSYSKKLDILTSNRKHLSDRLITDMAVALDLSVDEGPLDERIQELINCLQAMIRFEDRRLR